MLARVWLETGILSPARYFALLTTLLGPLLWQVTALDHWNQAAYLAAAAVLLRPLKGHQTYANGQVQDRFWLCDGVAWSMDVALA